MEKETRKIAGSQREVPSHSDNNAGSQRKDEELKGNLKEEDGPSKEKFICEYENTYEEFLNLKR